MDDRNTSPRVCPTSRFESCEPGTINAIFATIPNIVCSIDLTFRPEPLAERSVITGVCPVIALARDLVNKVANRFLDVTLDYVGIISNDEYLRKAVQCRWPVVNAFPRSRAASAFTKLVEAMDAWPIASSSGKRLEFFFERLFGAETRSVS